MYSLLSGLVKHLTRKEEVHYFLSWFYFTPHPRFLILIIWCPKFSVLILGLDSAGKTVSLTSEDAHKRYTLRLSLILFTSLQNFLEAIKSLYNDGQGLSPEKISSTIGQNSMYYADKNNNPIYMWNSICYDISWKDIYSIDNIAVLGCRRASRAAVDMESILWWLPCCVFSHRQLW